MHIFLLTNMHNAYIQTPYPEKKSPCQGIFFKMYLNILIINGGSYEETNFHKF